MIHQHGSPSEAIRNVVTRLEPFATPITYAIRSQKKRRKARIVRTDQTIMPYTHITSHHSMRPRIDLRTSHHTTPHLLNGGILNGPT
mmetsp:Transcript_34735/g.56257  ORF Transcript_34735/g.56257 Transcript_34735/m.56257 type:complete len:87 (-) Transcript_34735:462-722(-)